VGNPTLQKNYDSQLKKLYQFSAEKANSGDRRNICPLNIQIFYLCAGFSGAGAGASGAFSGAGAGASGAFSGAGAGAGASAGFGVSAGLQPTVKTTNNINDNTNAITFFIEFSPPSRIPFVSQR
jgi:hypothetical protein